MDADDRWTTLQLHLKRAKEAREAGNREAALAEVDAALVIDPDFIAARLLRDLLVAPSAAAAPPPVATERRDVVSADKYATIEARARRRRIEQRLGAARAGIAAGRFADAGAALEELATLDPTLAAIPALALELEAKKNAARRRRAMLSGVAVVAASALVGIGLGLIVGNWPRMDREPVARVEEPSARREEAPPVARAAAPPTVIQPDAQPATVTPPVAPPDATAEDTPASRPIQPPTATDAAPEPSRSRAAPVRVTPRSPAAPAEPRRIDDAPPIAPVPAPAVSSPAPVSPAASDSVASASRAVAPPLPEPEPAAAVPPTPTPASPASAPTAPPIPVDDAALIRETLQRYRRAYNGLDARLAHAVYPGVDETALAHAFEGLQSQSLEFESCTLDTQEYSARAVCRGSARFVPKVGSRAPRAEARVWTFRLNKDNGDWKITSAWTDR